MDILTRKNKNTRKIQKSQKKGPKKGTGLYAQ
jgi:hypothetical protein